MSVTGRSVSVTGGQAGLSVTGRSVSVTGRSVSVTGGQAGLCQ